MIKIGARLSSGKTVTKTFPNLGLGQQSRTPQMDKVIGGPGAHDLILLQSIVGRHTQALNQATRFATNMRNNERTYGDKVPASEHRKMANHIKRLTPLYKEEHALNEFLRWLRSEMARKSVKTLQYRITRGARVMSDHELNETRAALIDSMVSVILEVARSPYKSEVVRMSPADLRSRRLARKREYVSNDRPKDKRRERVRADKPGSSSRGRKQTPRVRSDADVILF